MVEHILESYPHFRAAILLVPGVFLLVLLFWLALDVAIHMATMDSCIYSFTAIGISMLPSLMLSYFVAKSNWEKECASRFFAAMAIRATNTGGVIDSKQNPLLVQHELV